MTHSEPKFKLKKHDFQKIYFSTEFCISNELESVEFILEFIQFVTSNFSLFLLVFCRHSQGIRFGYDFETRSFLLRPPSCQPGPIDTGLHCPIFWSLQQLWISTRHSYTSRILFPLFSPYFWGLSHNANGILSQQQVLPSSPRNLPDRPNA